MPSSMDGAVKLWSLGIALGAFLPVAPALVCPDAIITEHQAQNTIEKCFEWFPLFVSFPSLYCMFRFLPSMFPTDVVRSLVAMILSVGAGMLLGRLLPLERVDTLVFGLSVFTGGVGALLGCRSVQSPRSSESQGDVGAQPSAPARTKRSLFMIMWPLLIGCVSATGTAIMLKSAGWHFAIVLIACALSFATTFAAFRLVFRLRGSLSKLLRK